MAKITTPCVGVCSTVYGGNVCRGCKRFAHEVVSWNQYSENQKTLVWTRLNQLSTQVIQSKLHIIDETQLKNTLQDLGIRFHSHQPALCWAAELIRALSNPTPTRSLDSCGIAFEPLWENATIGQLKKAIHDELQALSEAHFDINHGRAKRLLENWD